MARLPGQARRRTARLSGGCPGLVEGGSEQVVERTQADLVARGDRLRRADQVGAGPALLGGDDRPKRPVDGLIQPFDDRVVLVQARAIDLDHQLGTRALERAALEPLDRLAEHLPVQVP